MEENHSLLELKIPTNSIEIPAKLKPFLEVTTEIDFFQYGLFYNYQNFSHYYASFSSTWIPYKREEMGITDDVSVEHIFPDVLRTMTNVIFTAKISIDCIDNLMNEYEKNSEVKGLNVWLSLYNEKIKEDPLCQFMKGLRHYVTHVGLIPCDVCENYKLYDPDYFYCFRPNNTILFSCKALKKGRYLNSEAKEYIINNEYNININNAISNYVTILFNCMDKLLDFLAKKSGWGNPYYFK